MKRRRIFPLPVEGIIDSPEFLNLPAAGRGMLFTMILHYWQSGCAPLPTKGSEVFAIVRAHPNTWATHRVAIERIFNGIKSELDDYQNYRNGRYEALREMGAKGHAVQRLVALRRKQVRHGEREDAVPGPEGTRIERPSAPEDRGARAHVAPGRKG